MGTTMVSDVDGGHCLEKKLMNEELHKEGSDNLHLGSNESTDYGDMTVLSNPDASTGRMESSSPIQALRKFARTPEKTKDASGEGDNNITVTEVSDQAQEPGTNGESQKKLNCSLRESKAREARSRVVVEKFEKKQHVQEEEVASDEASEDGIPDNIRHKFRKEFGSDLLEKLINCEQKKTLKSPEERRRSKSAHRAQRKMTRFSDIECGKGRASSATRMENYASRFRMDNTENWEQEEITLHMDSHCSQEPIQAVPREDMANGRQFDPDLHLTDLLKEVWVHKTYQQLGHCLRANTFPGCELLPFSEKPTHRTSEPKDLNPLSLWQHRLILPLEKVPTSFLSSDPRAAEEINVFPREWRFAASCKLYVTVAVGSLSQILQRHLEARGVAMPMQTISQESYTKEVNDKGRLEKTKAEHWHGKKTDPLGQWHERNFSNLNLIKALQQKNQDKLTKN